METEAHSYGLNYRCTGFYQTRKLEKHEIARTEYVAHTVYILISDLIKWNLLKYAYWMHFQQL